MLKNCPKRFIDWLTMFILIGTISTACFAGTSKILALILKDQFDSIYCRISAVETNQKVMNSQIEGMNNTINRIWYKVK